MVVEKVLIEFEYPDFDIFIDPCTATPVSNVPSSITRQKCLVAWRRLANSSPDVD